jgi:GNAT superfamily N-acetyltransferase
MLGKEGCAWAIGPVDGSTFGNYRFVTARRVNGIEYPRFFLEPDNPDAWPGHFVQAGFTPLASYHSALGDLAATDPVLPILQQRAQRAGASLRMIDLSQFEAELRRVFPVVTGSFQRNFLYAPTGEEEFMRQYLPVQAYLQPQLGWVAEKAGRAVGFLFALPNLAQSQRGEAVDTVIIKTVGVLPDAGVLGLGNLLVAECQTAAYALGYRRAIHAVMHDANISSKISRRYARIMRRYTLYARPLR